MAANLPVRHQPREAVLYVARPGLRALPAGTGTVILFIGLQGFAMITFIWAMWWPTPHDPRGWALAILGTAILVGAAAMVLWSLVRRAEGAARGIAMAPFIRLTVTDRRVLWSLPWAAEPLMEIGLARVRGGILGDIDRKGRGNAAIILTPGDPAGDDEGFIHLDRLPHAARFVDALAGR